MTDTPPSFPADPASLDNGALLVALGEQLLRRAEFDGRSFDSFTNEWLRHRATTGRHPLQSPGILTVLADVDRYCGNRLGEHEKDLEMRAFIRQRSSGANDSRRGNGR